MSAVLECLLLTLNKYFSEYLNEFTNFYPPWYHQKNYGFLTISGEIEVN